jgi:transcriptional regulator with XRE-family HTH domain
MGNPKVVAFGKEVVRRRTLQGFDQNDLARQAGLSPAGLRLIEQGSGVRGPKRVNVIKLAVALRWDPNDALRMLDDDDPVTNQEITTATRVSDPRDELDKLWPSLTEPQRWALVVTARTMRIPGQWPDVSELTREPTDVEPEDTGSDAPSGVFDHRGLRVTKRGEGEVPGPRHGAGSGNDRQ